MIHTPKVQKPDGYRIHCFEQLENKCRDALLFCERRDDSIIAFAIVDAVGQPDVTAKYVAEVHETLAKTPQLLKSPARVVDLLNRSLYDDPGSAFATLLVATLDTARHQIIFCNAGHHPILRYSKEGILDSLGVEESGLPIGLEVGLTWESVEHTVEIGDTLLCLNDRTAEAIEPNSPEVQIDSEDGLFFGDVVDALDASSDTENALFDGIERIFRQGGVDAVTNRIERMIEYLANAESPGGDLVFVVIERTG